MKRVISARVTGRVQGVGFRFSTAARARELGLAGWVRNTAGGGVEVWAQGDAGAIEQFIRFLETGPPTARVDDIRVSPGTERSDLTTFNVRY